MKIQLIYINKKNENEEGKIVKMNKVFVSKIESYDKFIAKLQMEKVYFYQ